MFKENQPLAGSSKRPDLALVHNSESAAIIPNVACTFENGPAAFDKVRTEKTQKYAHIAQALKGQFNEITVEAIVGLSVQPWKCEDACFRALSWQAKGTGSRWVSVSGLILFFSSLNYL